MKKFIISTAICATFFTGCSSPQVKQAKVIDSAVEGLEFQCAGMIDYTKSDGSIKCLHMPIAFKIGEIKLGIIYNIPKDGIILPQDIVGAKRTDLTNPDVIKLTVLLQSLDKDKNPDNGITITKETRDKLNEFIDIKKTSLVNIKDLVDAQLGTTTFKDSKSAIEHLEKSMKSYNINTPNIDLEGLE